MERLKAIAKSMGLTSYSRLRKEELQAFISDAMLLITECPTCGGAQCQPASNYFAPVQAYHTSATSSPDHNALAALGNNDLHDKLFDGDGPPASFINGQATLPGPQPDLARSIQQGGLDATADAARDAQSLNPIQQRNKEALATKATTGAGPAGDGEGKQGGGAQETRGAGGQFLR